MTPPARTFFALLVAAAGAGCDERQVRHSLEPSLERMMDQPRSDPFAENGAFDDRRAMRTPPEGTLATGGEAPPVRVDGAFVARVPYPVTRALLQRGRTRFEIWCAPCHGILGDGDSLVAQKMVVRRPPSLHDPRIVALASGAVEQVIEDGYGFMPSYAPMIPDPMDRWAIVAYLRALQLSQDARIADLPADVQSDLERAAR